MRDGKSMIVILNEVLSLNAQECERAMQQIQLGRSSMKS